MKDLSGQSVVIVGAARQGTALARYLLLHGGKVVLTDKLPLNELRVAQDSLVDLADAGYPLQWVCGGHPLSLLDGADLICLSGGVPLTMPLIAEARKRSIPLSNDSQIFLDATPCKVVGITGSAGKTTTTSLVGRMAQMAMDRAGKASPYHHIWVGGNIGSPLISMVDEMQPEDLAVVELSSFQLEIMGRSPHLAAVLNLTPNHLDRHGNMVEYVAAKARILDYQSHDDIAILGRDDPGAWSLAGKVRGRMLTFGLSELPAELMGALIRDGAIYLRTFEPPSLPGSDTYLMRRDDISLRGEHNLLNVMAACTIASASGLPLEAIRDGVKGFTGVPHRLEFIRRWGGSDWYNDSIATAPERSMAAIKSFNEPLVLLAGGRDKNLPWDEFSALVRQRVDHLILFGEAANLILKAVNHSREDTFTVTRCESLSDAVGAAAQILQPGDVVLLSPGCTSFDEFRDFEERGKCFTQWVKDLP